MTTITTKINNQQHPFHLVKPSPWPILIAFSLCINLIALVSWLHAFIKHTDCVFFYLIIPFSFFFFFYAFISWLWDIIIESTFEGHHTQAVQKGLKMGFILFIVSEIIFFFGFFWAFFHSSISPSIWIGAVWPPLGIQVINPWTLPLVNTIILLSSGITVTWAHKAILCSNLTKSTLNNINLRQTSRTDVIYALVLTILLGVFFTSIQLFEYIHSDFSINDGIYGSVFFMLTGFHGFHVFIGTVFLLICLFRHLAYHFTITHHLGLEMAIWYWHFVDIVWIFLFIFLYVWGA